MFLNKLYFSKVTTEARTRVARPTAECSSNYTTLHFVATPREEIRTLLITSATFFLLPDSRYKHSEFSQDNPTLGEFSLTMRGYARESVAQEFLLHFHCYEITHVALVSVELRTCVAIVHGLTTRPWKQAIQ